MHDNHRKNQSGFTLVEVLVAITILVIGILAVSQMTVMGMQTSTVINLRMYARSALDNTFENLHNLAITNLLLSDDLDAGDLDDTINADHSQTLNNQSTGYHSYRVMWNVANGVPDISYRTIRIWVIWRGAAINATMIRRNSP